MNVLQERLEQIFAQLSLQDLENQFPMRVATVESSSIRNPISIEEGAQAHLRNILGKYLGTGPLEIGRIMEWGFRVPLVAEEIVPSYFEPKKTGEPRLKSVGLESGYIGKIFDISRPLSLDTAQGSIYEIRVHPNATLHTITIFDRQYDVPQNVPAVMKKSPIYEEKLWKAYVVLKDALDKYSRLRFDLKAKRRYGDLFVKYGFKTDQDALLASDKKRMERSLRNKYVELSKQYNDIENEAYIDAIGYYLGSLLTEYNISPFYPLFYASFRTFDTGFFKGTAAIELPNINRNFPVEVIIIQPLNGKIADLYRGGYFYRIIGDDTSSIDTEKVMALLAQVIFGLNAGQHVFGIVNNDFHVGNLMFENVTYDYLYYGDLVSGKYWRIPTFSKVYKMIDFGRAHFRFGAFDFGNKMQSRALRGRVDTQNPNNDLYKFAYYLAYFLRIDDYLTSTEMDTPPDLQQLVALLSSILDCAGTNIFDVLEYCGDPTFPLVRQGIVETYGAANAYNCEKYVRTKWPYRVDSRCDNAIPKNNLHWFRSFEIDKEDVPEDTIIYAVF
jgi:hypothetical protein